MPTRYEMSRASESLQAVARKLGIKSQSELFALFLQAQRG